MNKLFFALSGFLLLFALLYYFESHPASTTPSSSQVIQQATSPPAQQPTAQSLNATLYQAAQQKFDAEIRETETLFASEKISINDVAARRKASENELQANRFNITNPSKACPYPEGYLKRDGSERVNADDEHSIYWFDLVGCEPGQFTGLPLAHPHELKTYSIKMYKYGRDQQLVEVNVKPDLINLYRHDDFTIIRELSDGNWELRGDVRFNFHGDVDHVVMTELP